MRIVVVLPAPLRPRRPVMVPCRTEKETPSTARTAPNVLVISRTERTSVISRFFYRECGVLYADRVSGYFGAVSASARSQIVLTTRLMARSIPPIGESSRRGAANAGTDINTTKTSVTILTERERRIHPPYGSRERALLSNLEGALSIGVTGRDISLPQKVIRVTTWPR